MTVNTGSNDGTVGLNLVDDDSIQDSGNRKLGGTGLGNGNFTGQVYTVDKTAPTVALSGSLRSGKPGQWSNSHYGHQLYGDV